MNEKERKRLLVLNRMIGGETMVKDAAKVLGLSERQVRRILAAYRREGTAALAHGEPRAEAGQRDGPGGCASGR